jgi:energy-coupling factor transport system substrate-specific component
VFWWAYSFLYDIISPPLKTFGLSGLIEGIWQFAGIFFAYIIRKPGSAILGETIAAIIEGTISQWGLSALVSGLAQGLPVELVFLLCRYKIWNYWTVALAGISAAIGGYIVSYYWDGYNHLSVIFNVINLSSSIVSSIVFGGILAKYCADKLARNGVLNQFSICHDTSL